MLTDHQKTVAKRNAKKDQESFFKYLRYCGWKENEIKEMWEYAQIVKDNKYIGL